jgi:predicted nucleic acid-binding protein
VPADRYLVDTSAWILALRKNFQENAKTRIDELLRYHLVFTTDMIKLELLSGTKTEKEFDRLETRFEGLVNIEADRSIWFRAFKLGFHLRRKGLTIPHTDILIASCALQRDAIVLHADAHFDLMGQKASLRVESLIVNADV